MKRQRYALVALGALLLSLSPFSASAKVHPTRTYPAQPSDFSAEGVVLKNTPGKKYKGNLYVDATKERLRFDVDASAYGGAYTMFAFWDKDLVYISNDEGCLKLIGMDAALEVFPSQGVTAPDFNLHFLSDPYGLAPFDIELFSRRKITAIGNNAPPAQKFVVQRWKHEFASGESVVVDLKESDPANVPYFTSWRTPTTRFKISIFGAFSSGAPAATVFNLPAECVG